jgi:hypothetical protein
MKKLGGERPVARGLDGMIREVLVDCYSGDEERTAFFTMIEDRLRVPFRTRIFGLDAVVERFVLNEEGAVHAVCRRGRERRRIPILDLPLQDPPPKGFEWIEAYRHWLSGSPRQTGEKSGLLSLVGGWRGSEELAKAVRSIRRSKVRKIPRLD